MVVAGGCRQTDWCQRMTESALRQYSDSPRGLPPFGRRSLGAWCSPARAGAVAPNWWVRIRLERAFANGPADNIARVKRSPARAFRAGAAVVLGAAFAFLTATGAAASPAPAPGPLTPLVDCVSSSPGAAPDAFTVVFGYLDAASASVTLPPGTVHNTFTLGGDRGQPATFEPGIHHAVFATTFAGARGDLAWTLGGSTVTVGPSTPSCETATTVTISAPATAVAGDTVDVSATVGRMLLGAPTAGTVEFAFDSAAAGSASASASATATVSAPLNTNGVARATLVAPDAGEHTLTARYVPPAATPQMLGSSAGASLTVTWAGTISIASAGLSADGRSARFVVSRTAADSEAHVDYVTADGSARAGTDYASSRGTVRFTVGQSSVRLTVPLLDRPFGSPGASFYVLLQRASETVDVAGATGVLPEVTAVTTRPPGQGSVAGGFVRPPQVPPSVAAPTPATGAAGSGGISDLALMFGGLLLTVGAASGVIGLMRLRSSDDASAS